MTQSEGPSGGRPDWRQQRYWDQQGQQQPAAPGADPYGDVGHAPGAAPYGQQPVHSPTPQYSDDYGYGQSGQGHGNYYDANQVAAGQGYGEPAATHAYPHVQDPSQQSGYGGTPQPPALGDYSDTYAGSGQTGPGFRGPAYDYGGTPAGDYGTPYPPVGNDQHYGQDPYAAPVPLGYGAHEPPPFDAGPHFGGAGHGAGTVGTYDRVQGGYADPHGHHRDAAGYDDSYDDEEEDEEEGGSRFGWKLMAGLAAVGVVVAVTGMVMYNAVLGGVKSGDEIPIVRASRDPAKIAPENPGGQQFGRQDSKVLGRLDNSNGQTSETQDGSRVRTVPVIKVGRDGRLILPKEPETATPPAAVSAEASNASESPFPGINVSDSLNGRALPPVVPQVRDAHAAPRDSETGTRVATQVIVPQVAAPPTTETVSAAPGQAADRAQPAPTGPLPPVPTKSGLTSGWRASAPPAADRSDAAAAVPTVPRSTAGITVASSAARATVGAPAPATAAGGAYVVVLATKPSRIEALKSFADIQQQHAALLQNREPDIQEADLSSRGLGMMYRVIVGPPGSRDSANALCNNLKASGYQGCWIKAY